MWQFRIPTWIVLFVLGLLVQTALLPQIFPSGYVPNMILPLTVIIALYETPRRALLAGLIGGLMQDLWAGRTWGLDALTFALLGYGIGLIQSRVMRDQVFVPGLLAGVSQLVVIPFQWVLLRLFGYDFSWLTFMKPLPDWILFSMLMAPALGGILGFRARHEIESSYARSRAR